MSPSKMAITGDAGGSPYYVRQLERVARLKRKLWLVPFVCGLMMPFTFGVPYLFAVINKQVDPIFPFISDSGSAGLPSSHIFSSFLDCFAILWFIMLWIRYKQVTYYLTEELPAAGSSIDRQLCSPQMLDRLHRLNFWATISLMLVSPGCMLVGNFRSTEELLFHGIGVSLVLNHLFIGYPCMIYLNAKLYRAGLESPPRTLTASMIIAWLSMIACSVCLLASIPWHQPELFLNATFRLRWPKDSTYWWHVASSIFEWILMGTTAIIGLAMSRRMRHFKHWDRVSI